MSLLTTVGESVKANTTRHVSRNAGEYSVWFPHGPLGFGGHYSPGQIRKFLSEMPLEELGAKGLKLRVIVGGFVSTIVAGGSYLLK